jgi:multidrug efflux pump subunit AcrB
MIRWFTQNGIAANFLMMGILVLGLYTAYFRTPLEVTPALSWDTVMIEIPYRGATAKDIERAILIPVEEALEGVNGIKMVNADGSRGMARFYLNAKPGADLRSLMDDVKARVDAIMTLPQETERPRVFIPESSNVYEVVSIAVTGKLPPHALRKVARRVQDDLLERPGISNVRVLGGRTPQINIEADPQKLVSYNLSFQELANAVRRYSIDLPAGSIDSESGTYIVRTKGQAYSEEEFATIPIRSEAGADVRLGDVASVTMGFEEDQKIVDFNGTPALMVQALRTGVESAIQISNEIHDYVATEPSHFPNGIDLYVWKDKSIAIRGRLGTLTTSLVQGCVLVLLVLGLFLRPSLAFWVVLGIPVAFAGGLLAMPWFGVTANMMSLFGFIIVLGVVVDDAIITGENVYLRLREGMDPFEAAVQGTKQVAVPVTFGVITTIVAFIPLLYFDGTWGDYAKQIPPVVAPVLLFSLVESKLILPAHLKHLSLREGRGLFSRFQTAIARGLERFVDRVYQPSLEWAANHRMTVLSVFITMGLAMTGYCLGGRMGFSAYPSVDTTQVIAYIDLPGDSNFDATHAYINRFTEAVDQLEEEFVDPGSGRSMVKNVSRLIGGRSLGRGEDKSQGYVMIEVLSPEERTEPGPDNTTIANRWKEIIGPIPEATSYRVFSEKSSTKGRHRDDDQFLTLELRGPTSPNKAKVAEEIKALLASYDQLTAAWAHVNYGQDELVFTAKPRAVEIGLDQAQLARQIRQAFYGEEAQRVQVGVDDLRVMVRLPEWARESLHTLDQLKIRTPRGANVPLETVADIAFNKAPTFVERNDHAEIIRCGAQPVTPDVDLLAIANEIEPKLQAMCQVDETLSFQFTGLVAEAEESRRRTIIGSIALALALYALLAIPFKSMLQPLFVMLSLPFGIIGALLGHIIMGVTPSYLSVFGMLALAGVVVNDSLVLVDYINRRLAEGRTLREAALAAGKRRFRPILLTSLTTFVGLLPLLVDNSLQAQFLIPMAISLGFGVLFATVITLYLIPCALLMAEDLRQGALRFRSWYFRPIHRLVGKEVERPSSGDF